MDQIEEMLEYFPAMPSPMPSSQPEYLEGSDLLPENAVLPESSVPPSLTLVLTPYILFMSFTITLLVLLQIFRFFQIGCYSEQRRNERTDSSSPRQQWYSWELDTFVVSLDIQDRVELYRRAFERNQHRHTLEDENFCPTETPSESETANETLDRQLSEMEDQSNVAATENHGSDGQGENENENSPWIYLRLMKRSVTEQKLAQTDGGEDDKGNDINSGSNSSKNDSSSSNNSDSSNSNSDGTLTKSCKPNETVPRTKILGNCIICFEDFCVGDTVVWSEDPTICKHVYHENCLAQFLATHSYQIDPYTNTHGSYSENPCPTCRHPFCTITQEDLVQSILLKSIEMANKNRSD